MFNVRKRIVENNNKINDKLLRLYERIDKGFNSLRNDIAYLPSKMLNTETTDMLIQALCDKYKRGTYIMYDEHNPREIVIIKDGKRVDMSRAKSAMFSWYCNEFPTLSIDRA